MARIASRKQVNRGGGDVGTSQFVKREPGMGNNRAEMEEGGTSDSGRQGMTERRVLRSRYLAVKNLINDERDGISMVDSDKFNSIITEVESLHRQVQKPREQVADAEALLDIANTLVTSVKSQGNDGISASDFVTCLLRDFGQQGGGGASTENARDLMVWGDIGTAVSHIFRKAPGCCTMLGPMDTELKQRKAMAQRKRVRPTESSRPEDLDATNAEEKTDTDKNMSTMFDILRKKKSVKLENLVLNRNSFSQTVENVFALSFLIKDGRAKITVDESNSHLVSPKNAPAANAVTSGEVTYNHFVFRFDFKDWKLMKDLMGNGEELMPHRTQTDIHGDSQATGEHARRESQAAAPTTPIRKLCRNRGLVIQEEPLVEDSPESDIAAVEACAIRKGKRKLV